MRNNSIKQTVFGLLVFLFSISANALENVLIFGDHQVGFKYKYLLDQEREWIPFPFDSTETPKTNLRPMRLAIWYPAKKSDSKRMHFNN